VSTGFRRSQGSDVKVLRILVAIAALALVGKASGQTVTVLYSFSGVDGANPCAGLVQGTDGNFYGTTEYGGSTNCPYGCGTVLRITPSGSLTNLYSFGGGDGAYPIAVPIQGSDGNFYGTTVDGGASTNCSGGCGTVFRITAGGSLTNLHTFGWADGAHPEGGLVQGTDDYFYGTTFNGGSNGLGSVFRIDASGTFTTLWDFCSSWNGYACTDGNAPGAGLMLGGDGNFYGTTEGGGSGSLTAEGTVFRITPSGNLTTLYSFGGGSDAYSPQAPLVQGRDGNLYSATWSGGTGMVAGAVFRISLNGNFTNVCYFDAADGGYPFGGVVQGSDGSFYGVTADFGAFNQGTVFRVSPSGNLTNLHSFLGGVEGSNTRSVLVQGIDGSFYGTTFTGGLYGSGSVFKISVPLNPPANQISSALVDSSSTNVAFTIPSVAGETYQLQFATDLVAGNWSNVVGVCVSNSIGAALTVTNFGGATGPQGFYRFAITP
jgi:uncharacterized repeat protein (TIGR03803 family)